MSKENEESIKKNKCGQCKSYVGEGDFGLCCSIHYDLCYEDSDACGDFDEMK